MIVLNTGSQSVRNTVFKTKSTTDQNKYIITLCSHDWGHTCVWECHPDVYFFDNNKDTHLDGLLEMNFKVQMQAENIHPQYVYHHYVETVSWLAVCQTFSFSPAAAAIRDLFQA